MTKSDTTCWVCGSSNFKLIKQSDVNKGLTSANFAITNFDYGKTGELKKCRQCGFIQCTDLHEVIRYYEDLEDQEYEKTRKERKLQEERLVRYLGKYKKEGSLLDIGAGSGIMVEAALDKGYKAEGVEPSRWLQKNAAKLSLPVHQGIFPHPKILGPYDIITFVDVIEHITHPADMLREIHHALGSEGIFVVVTPDVDSFAARLLKYKWWHYRFAHIGYFNRNTLKMLLEKTGFEIVKISRPAWYFNLRYLGIRFFSFMPKYLRFSVPRFFDQITIPVNLRDSLLVICKKKVSSC